MTPVLKQIKLLYIFMQITQYLLINKNTNLIILKSERLVILNKCRTDSPF